MSLNKGVEPNKILLRAREIESWLGICIDEFHKCVRAGLVPYKIIKPNGRKYYKKEDIKRIFIEGFK